MSFAATFLGGRKDGQGQTSPGHLERENHGGSKVDSAAAAAADGSPVNWMDVLKDTRDDRKDDHAKLPKSPSGKRNNHEIRIIDNKDKDHNGESPSVPRRPATLSAATGRTVAPSDPMNVSLARSSPLQSNAHPEAHPEQHRPSRPPIQYDTVTLKRERLESSSAIYVDMPSVHAVPPAVPPLSPVARTSPRTVELSPTGSNKRRGPEDALKEWRTLITVGRVDDVRAFLELMGRELDVNLACKGRRTALHAAAEAGNVPLARMLIANGADRSAKDGAGKTPVELTTNTELVDLLAPPSLITTAPTPKAAEQQRDDRALLLLLSDWNAAQQAKNTAALPDVYLVNGEYRVGAHRLMLAARVPELAQSLPPPLPSGPTLLPMKHAARALELLVEFIYTDNCQLKEEGLVGSELAELLALAHTYKLPRLTTLLLPLLVTVLKGAVLLRFLKSMAALQVATQVREVALAVAASEFKHLTDEHAEQLLSLGKVALQIAANSANPPPVPPLPPPPERTLQRDLAALLDGRFVAGDASLGGVSCHSSLLQVRGMSCDLPALRNFQVSTRAARAVLRYFYCAELDTSQLTPLECLEVIDVFTTLLTEPFRRPMAIMQHLSLAVMSTLDSSNCLPIFVLASKRSGPELDSFKRAALKILLANFGSRTIVDEFISVVNPSPMISEVLLGLSAQMRQAPHSPPPPPLSPSPQRDDPYAPVSLSPRKEKP